MPSIPIAVIVAGKYFSGAAAGAVRPPAAHLKAVLLSVVGTAAFVGYSAWVVHDIGEFWWLHVVYLVAVLAVFRRDSAQA